MASLIAEQLTMMLKTIHDAANANSAAIANLTQAQQASERAWQVAHEELHARVHQLQKDQATSGKASHRRSLIDPKTLIPDAYNGEQKSQSWRDWSYRLKSFIGSIQPSLQNAMERAEHKMTPVLENEFAQLAIDPVGVNDLKALLTQKTTGYAHTIIRQHDVSNGLEMYRCLAQHFEPDTDARNLDDLRQILHPAAATSMDDFARKFPAWKALCQTRLNRIGQAAVLGDDIRLTIWMDMLPPKERDDVTRHRHFWKDSDALDRHLLQLISDRSRVSPPSHTQLAHVEREESDGYESCVDPDTGDTHIFRIEPTTGKRSFVRTRQHGQFRARKCYLCGRAGHMAADCHAKTHVDGGPPRPKREEGDHPESPASKPKQVIIEGVTYIAADAVDQVVNLGLVEAYCDMCGLEPEQDLWKGGKSTKLKSQFSAAPVPKISTPAPTAANHVGTKAAPETAKSALSFSIVAQLAVEYCVFAAVYADVSN